MTMATATDDADRMPYGCDTFDACPAGDRDIMSDEWELACGRPGCGGPEYVDGQNVGCPGCRKCSPPDHEAKPYGWGIERFEDPALTEANEFVASRVYLWSLYAPPLDWYGSMDARLGERNRRWAANSRHNAKLARCSDRLWDRLCDECETHAEAVEKYGRWAVKVTDKVRRK